MCSQGSILVAEPHLCRAKRSMGPRWGRKGKGRVFYGSKFGRDSATRPLSRFSKEVSEEVNSPRRRFGDSLSSDSDSGYNYARPTRFRNGRKKGLNVRRLGRDMLIGYYDNSVAKLERRSIRPRKRKGRKGYFGRKFGREVEDLNENNFEEEDRSIRPRKRKGRKAYFARKFGREVEDFNEYEVIY